jgi:hypothetical protein
VVTSQEGEGEGEREGLKGINHVCVAGARWCVVGVYVVMWMPVFDSSVDHLHASTFLASGFCAFSMPFPETSDCMAGRLLFLLAVCSFLLHSHH